jgi:hypothetical protein
MTTADEDRGPDPAATPGEDDPPATEDIGLYSPPHRYERDIPVDDPGPDEAPRVRGDESPRERRGPSPEPPAGADSTDPAT